MINKEGLSKMLRDLRVLDFLKEHLNFSMEDEQTLNIESFSDNECNYDTIQIHLPEYILKDIYEWVMDDEI